VILCGKADGITYMTRLVVVASSFEKPPPKPRPVCWVPDNTIRYYHRIYRVSHMTERAKTLSVLANTVLGKILVYGTRRTYEGGRERSREKTAK